MNELDGWFHILCLSLPASSWLEDSVRELVNWSGSDSLSSVSTSPGVCCFLCCRLLEETLFMLCEYNTICGGLAHPSVMACSWYMKLCSRVLFGWRPAAEASAAPPSPPNPPNPARLPPPPSESWNVAYGEMSSAVSVTHQRHCLPFKSRWDEFFIGWSMKAEAMHDEVSNEICGGTRVKHSRSVA